jgi:hypothetical protein
MLKMASFFNQNQNALGVTKSEAFQGQMLSSGDYLMRAIGLLIVV